MRSEIRSTPGGNTYITSVDASHSLLGSMQNGRPRHANACSCRTINQVNVCGPLAFLQFRKVFRRQHYCRCPESKSSETALELLMKITPPTWLLRHTISLGISLHNWGSQGGWKLSPLIVGISRLVDSRVSPAFQAIGKIFDYDTRSSTVSKEKFQTLEKTLRDLFVSGQASGLDEDESGNTILYVSYLLNYPTFQC